VQRRGKGSPRYRAKRDSVARVKFPFNYTQKKVVGEIGAILHNNGKSSPLAKIILEDGSFFYVPAGEGTYLGQKIEIGTGSAANLGNILPIGELFPGFPAYNIENMPGDGGSFFRAAGAFGEVIGKEANIVYVKMKSGEKKKIDPKCFCIVGVVAGGGRTVKPFCKAGNKHFLMKARGGRIYPRVRGYAMNAVDHPHGGSGHNSAGRQKVKPKKFGAPGQKVGFIGAKRTGRRKK